MVVAVVDEAELDGALVVGAFVVDVVDVDGPAGHGSVVVDSMCSVVADSASACSVVDDWAVDALVVEGSSGCFVVADALAVGLALAWLVGGVGMSLTSL
jgi:hypothetical protein